MSATEFSHDATPPEAPSVDSIPDERPAEDSPAWEQVDAGRYRPRRIRGSCRGRELG